MRYPNARANSAKWKKKIQMPLEFAETAVNVKHQMSRAENG